MRRGDVLIVTGANSSRKFPEMVRTNLKYIEFYGYDHKLFDFGGLNIGEKIKSRENVDLLKTFALLEVIKENRPTIWLNSDSILFRSIDEVFNETYDAAVPIKNKGTRSNKYGSYLCSNFIVIYPTLKAKYFIQEWHDNRLTESSQKNLHTIFENYMKFDNSFYNKKDCIIDLGKSKIKLLSSDSYTSVLPMHEMRRPYKHEKVLHFKGRLHRDKWDAYSERFLC